MHFSVAIIASVLSASTLAAPSPGLQKRLSRRASARHGQPLVRIESANAATASNQTHTDYSSNWSGAVIESPPSGTTFDAVSAKITVPQPSKPQSVSGSSFAASAWVGIDGNTYSSAILQTGVDFTVDEDGSTSYNAWYEWYPDNSYDFDLDISAGDVISMSVTADTSTRGVATLVNESTGSSVTKTISSSSALGGQNAEWIVEDFQEGGSLVAFADFGTVIFSDCVASASGEDIGTTGASTIDIQSKDGEILTSVSISKTEVKVTYT